MKFVSATLYLVKSLARSPSKKLDPNLVKTTTLVHRFMEETNSNKFSNIINIKFT